MGMMLQVTWQLMHLLCIIAIATVVPGSSGFGEPLSLESSSLITSIEAQVPSSIDSRGPLLIGSNVQPPIVSTFIKSSPMYQKIQGSLPFLSPSESTWPTPEQDFRTSSAPTQALDDLAPPLPAEPTSYPDFTAATPSDSSPTPVARVSHGLVPALPVAEPPFYTNPPPSAEASNNLSMTPSSESPHVSAVSSAKPPEAIPQLPNAEPPVTSPGASLATPPEVSRPTSTIQFPPVAEAPVIVVAPSHQSPQPLPEPPHSSALPLAVKPPESKPPSSVAEPSQGWTLTPPPTKLTILSFPPPAMPPPKISQPTSTMQSPPITASEAPIVSPQPPVAKPPHRTALPLAAKTPESMPPLPVAEPPQGLTITPIEAPPNLSIPPPTIAPHSEDMQPPPVPVNPSSSPTYTHSPPPQIVSPHAPPPMSTAPSNPSLLPPSMSPPSTDPPTTLPSPLPPLPPQALTPPPQLNPPDVSSPPPELNPPTVNAPPPQLTPPISSAPPPQLTPPIVSSPPPKLNPPIVSAPPQVNPPIESSPPSEVNPPIVFAPPQINPPIVSSPPPELNPPILSAPPPQLNPPIVTSPPPELNPPNMSSPPPQLAPPTLSSPPPQLIPPIASSPPPQLIPPIASPSPPKLIPPAASPPISVVPPNSTVPPPLIVPPPKESSPLQAVPPHASATLSPPLPSHASPPLAALSPPLAALSPPYVLPAPPSLELPHLSPPRPPIVNGSVPSHASPPSSFSTPPLAPTSPVIPSHPLYAPPPIESSHSSVPPPVAQRTVPAAPPHSSQTKVPQEGAPPPSPASSEPSPPSKTLPEGSPPAHQVTPRSHPPSSHQIEAPKRAPFMRSNDSEPGTSPSSTPPPRKSISHRRPSTVPPGRAPDQSPRDNISPYHAPSKPRFERHNASAPAPFPFTAYPRHNESHHSPRHSPVKGSPSAITPSQSPETPEILSAPSPLAKDPPGHSGISFPSPKISPSGSSTRNTKKPLAPPILSLPPPPPNADCAYLTCPEPLTNTPPGSPCSCVWPMQVGLRLSVALFTFFPLVTELSREIAAGVFMKQSQVRVMGANAASEQSEKTIVLVDLVPLHEKFDNVTSELTFQRFWHKQVVIDKSKFGDYEVLYVRYPGLPPSPPMAPADMAIINGMPYSLRDPNQSKAHPLGVDVTKQGHKRRLSGIAIAAIVFSAIVGVLICCSIAWVLVFRHKNLDPQPGQTPRALPSLARLSGPTGNSTGSGPSSSMSIGSSLATYAGSAKTFSASEIEKATDNLSPSRIIGEGGFGLVYGGVLEDETSVAVKVLKRDDHQGGREFLAEVEMLSRLHHRNLVKLIGICTDEHLRCLVYELIPNGSVDSHLHGTDREIAPLDWASRMKIALGAARGLAYLHEDSSPRVIHRDFKSSNILLENDFTPKVSDFGLARTAMDEENKHISTRVMGTFGYVAPEYAMTGHLLVKSDVYSYGVVLLELLTGRKPVDMSQPAGQENIVAWTRPFLSTKEGLELILDPSLGSDVPLDSVLKVAAIASMCVQPEVSHRPFMGEVVQALKLVCNECDDSKDGNSRPPSHENLLLDFEAKESPVSETRDYLPTQFSHQNFLPAHDVEKGVSVSEIFGASTQIDRQASNSFRRHSASGPLKTGRGRQFWQRIGRRSNGSASEHSMMYRLWSH